MLKRNVEGEPEEFARLRGSIVKACDIAHFNKNMAILKKDAKSCGINIQTALAIWEKAKCPDLTTKSGMGEYNRVYNKEMSVLD
jgi:hypothetical protein